MSRNASADLLSDEGRCFVIYFVEIKFKSFYKKD